MEILESYSKNIYSGFDRRFVLNIVLLVLKCYFIVVIRGKIVV